MDGLAAYVKEGLPFAQVLSLENSLASLRKLFGFTSVGILLSYPLLMTFFIFMHSFLFYFIYHSSLDQPIC